METEVSEMGSYFFSLNFQLKNVPCKYICCAKSRLDCNYHDTSNMKGFVSCCLSLLALNLWIIEQY